MCRSCNSINRWPCGSTPRTCGPCLDGFIGVDGDSNTPCQTLVASRRRLIASSGSSCTSNSSCISQSCRAGVCTKTVKSCANSCAQAGKCKFVTSTGPISQQSCLANDPFCQGQCTCNKGRYTSDCSISSRDTFQRQVAMRESLCLAMLRQQAIQDVTAEVVRSRTSSISNIFVDSTAVVGAALSNCSDVLLSTVLNQPSLACQPSTLQALSAMLAVKSSSLSRLLNRLMYAVEVVASACQASVIPGGPRQSYTYSTLRVSLQATSAKALQQAPVRFFPARSKFEIFDKTTLNPVTVSMAPSAVDGTVGISVIEFVNNPRGLNTTSHPLTVLVTVDGDFPSVDVEVVLENMRPVDYTTILPSTIITPCQRAMTPYIINNISCPDGVKFSVTCPGYKSESLLFCM